MAYDTETTEAVSIGAGLSGLQAARSLHDAGVTTVVLEARSRIGGKTWSIPGSRRSTRQSLFCLQEQPYVRTESLWPVG